MFRQLELPEQRYWVIALLLIWSGLLLGGFLLERGHEGGSRRMPTWTRIGSSLTLVVAAWSWCWFTRATSAQSFSLLIAAGMSLGFIGDLFIADLVPGLPPILGGIGSFGLGHVAYIIAVWQLGNDYDMTAPWARWGGSGAWLATGLLGWTIIVYPSNQPAALRWAALPYTLLLSGTAGLATWLCLQSAVFGPLALGASLFL
jgi:hypothetical protein